MRWIDIDLSSLTLESATARRFDAVVARENELLAIQERDGLDHPRVVAHIREVGQELFRAVLATDPTAFAVEDDRGAPDPAAAAIVGNGTIGFHFIVPAPWVGLPWTWLHNGIAFLLEKHPLTAGTTSSRLPDPDLSRPWMQRCHAAMAGTDLLDLLAGAGADPEILFVPGHCREEIRNLIYREAEGIRRALATAKVARSLANLRISEHTITPAMLARRGALYQGLHFAAATAQPLDAVSAAESAWIDELAASACIEADVDGDLAAEYDQQMEILGVDPITAMLDSVAAMTEHRSEDIGPAPRQATATICPPPAWDLEDGPFQPEEMAQGGLVPALIFSNSYRSLPTMGARFLHAGASCFVGPLAPIFSRPARSFAGSFYDHLGAGCSSGAALRLAALACRERFGPEHPAWLSYGAAGYGTLALQYL